MERVRLAIFTLFLSATFWGCNKNTTTVELDPVMQKVWVHVQQGDKVQFANFAPTFVFNSPCEEGKEANPGQVILDGGICTIKSTATPGVYPYECMGCPDPEIAVDSEIGPLKARAAANALQEAADTIRPVLLSCVMPAGIKMYPREPVKEDKTEEITIKWDGDAGAVHVSDWTIPGFTQLPNGAYVDICKQSPPFNANNQACTLDKNKVTADTTYTYAVTSGSCSPGTEGKITILP